MYSRSLSGRNSGDEKYRANVPPKYSGSRFSTNQDLKNLPEPQKTVFHSTGRNPAADERRAPPSREIKADTPVKVAPDRGIPEMTFTDEIIDENDVISLPDFELSSDMFASRRSSAFSPTQSAVYESASYEPIPEQELDDAQITDTDISEVSGHAHDQHEKEKREGHAKEASKGGFLANIFGGGGEKGIFSYEDLLLGGLILLISSSGTKDNEDILIILALLLAYR